MMWPVRVELSPRWWTYWIIAVSLCALDVQSTESGLDSLDGGPDPRCERVGQLLEDASSRCHYLVCEHGSTTWKEVHGQDELATRRMPCAPGTHVKQGFEDTGYGKQWSPCTGTGHQCLPGMEGKSAKGGKSVKAKGKSKTKFKRRSVYNKENSYYGYRKMSSPMSKKAPLLTPREDTDRLRHLVGFLSSIVEDQVDRFERVAPIDPYDTQAEIIGGEWKQIKREVGSMMSALSPRGSQARAGLKSARLNRADPRTLRRFSRQMMAVMLRLMRLNERTDDLVGRKAAALEEQRAKETLEQELNSLEDFQGNALHLKRSDGKKGEGSASKRKFYDDEMEMHHSTDVFMMGVMMDRLQGRGEEHYKYGGHAGKEKLGYGDYKTLTFDRSKGGKGLDLSGSKSFKYKQPKIVGFGSPPEGLGEGIIDEYDVPEGLGLRGSKNAAYVLEPVNIRFVKPPTTPRYGDKGGFTKRKTSKRGGPPRRYAFLKRPTGYRGAYTPPFRHMPDVSRGPYRVRFRRSHRVDTPDTPNRHQQGPKDDLRAAAKMLRRDDLRREVGTPPAKENTFGEPEVAPKNGPKESGFRGSDHYTPSKGSTYKNSGPRYSHYRNKADGQSRSPRFNPLKLTGNVGDKGTRDTDNPGTESGALRAPSHHSNPQGSGYDPRRPSTHGGPKGPRHEPSGTRPASAKGTRQRYRGPQQSNGDLSRVLNYRQKRGHESPSHILARSKRI